MKLGTMKRALAGLAGLHLCTGAALAEGPAIAAGVYSAAQAARGEAAYARTCAQCHGRDLVSKDDEAPSLTGPAFKFAWVGKTLGERFERISTTMPPAKPGSLEPAVYLDILAYILKVNGFPAGQDELALGDGLKAITITAP